MKPIAAMRSSKGESRRSCVSSRDRKSNFGNRLVDTGEIDYLSATTVNADAADLIAFALDGDARVAGLFGVNLRLF